MSGVYVVTGANRGLGRAAAEQLLIQGKLVVLGCREPEPVQARYKNRPNAIVLPLDVSDELSTMHFGHVLIQQQRTVAALINNAGVFLEHSEDFAGTPNLANAEMDLIRRTMETNAYGAIRMYQALNPLFEHGARIVNVSSGMGQLSEMNGGWPGYRLSKTAVNAVTRMLAEETSDRAMIVSSVCPGWCQTDMGGAAATRTAEQGADTIVWLATHSDLPSGKFWRDRKEIAW
ncbi:SDR family NAD(P)-dependent oxidoreductase [Permianibacter sp. IMCC34836]|uniref:SDR family NAD(P)-dependent oxidoreductase n=1 Tax=Permianibacter fluminis TaxID=2738515 RepID=UPI00155793AD|nr:SDR family NAD(P)-dependent oxidoreductase [Permianibacter fluminis]NQD38821.1 SDR family NAD(P)-dependent oxidoreductase [Permianibacter fluminis]